MTALKVQLRRVDQLRPDPDNARVHSEEQIGQIADSIRRFGWTQPILADDVIRAGNGRHAAALLIYAESDALIHLPPGKDRGGPALPRGTVPVIDCSGWSPEERQAYALADNQLTLLGGWDESKLAEQLKSLLEADFQIGVIGFDADELDRLFNPPDTGKADPDAIPPEPAVPATRAGDLWLLGDHRLKCGDATCAADVESVLNGHVPLLMVTDPPYGVDYDPSWRNRDLASWKAPRAVGKVQNDDRSDWGDAWALFPGDVAYVWHAGNHASSVEDSLARHGLLIRSQIIWVKQSLVIGRGDYHPRHEPCWYAVRKGKAGHYRGGRKQSTVWEIRNASSIGGGHSDDKHTGHGTQKPVECMKRPIENNSKPGGLVYDPFLGSGTSLIACQMTGRHCRALDLNEVYCDVAIERWQDFTGEVARLEATGQTFAEVKAERLGGGGAPPAQDGEDIARAPDGLAPVPARRKRRGTPALVGSDREPEVDGAGHAASPL